MKTIHLLLVLWACCCLRLQAQPPAPTPSTAADREAEMRRALERAYAQLGVTNAANRPTNPPATLPALRTNLAQPTGYPITTAPPPTTNLAAPNPAALTPRTNSEMANAAGVTNPSVAALAPPPLNPAAVPPATTGAIVPAAPPSTSGPTTIRPTLSAPPSPRPTTPPGVRVNPLAPPPVTPRAPGTATAAAPPVIPPALGGGAAGDTNVAQTFSAIDDPTVRSDDQILAPGVIKFQDADLLQVLDVYQELTGRTILRPAALSGAKISIRSQSPLTRRQAVQALDSVLSLNQIAMVPQGDLFVKAMPAASVGMAGAQITDLPGALLPESGSFVTHVVTLKNAVPSAIVQALQPFANLPSSILAIDSSGILVLRDYAENVKRMLELLEQIDVVPIQEFEPIVIPIKYALAADIAQVLSSLTAGGGGATTVGSSQSRTGLTPPAGLSATPGGLGGANPYNQAQNRFGTQGGVGGAPGGAAAGTRGSFQDRLRSIVSRAAQGDIVVLGDTKIIADERTNALLIFASKQDIATIRDIIDKLDVVLPQVIIEAIIMEVSLGDKLDYGVSYLQTKPTTAGDFFGVGGIANKDVPFLSPSSFGNLGSNALGGGFSYFARFSDFEATVRATASDSRINVLSRPRIQTSHAVEANLFIGETRPYVTGTYFGFSGQPQSQYQQQQIGITLTVLPLINPEGLVVMDIRQKIQSIGQQIQVDANFSVPATIDREANAKVSVRDRETVMLGGFISADLSKNKSGVPILKDIPLLGNLFRSSSRTQNRNELIVLIRPTVLPNPEEAALVASEERSRLPGIAAAERDFTDAERKRQRRAQKELLSREGLPQ